MLFKKESLPYCSLIYPWNYPVQSIFSSSQVKSWCSLNVIGDDGRPRRSHTREPQWIMSSHTLELVTKGCLGGRYDLSPGLYELVRAITLVETTPAIGRVRRPFLAAHNLQQVVRMITTAKTVSATSDAERFWTAWKTRGWVSSCRRVILSVKPWKIDSAAGAVNIDC